MKNNKIILVFIVLLAFICFGTANTNKVKAEQLSDSIDEQLEQLDFTALENFFNSISHDDNSHSAITLLNQLLEGKGYFSYDNFGEYIFSVLLLNVKKMLPTFVSVLIIAILCGFIKNFKSHYISNGVNNIVVFVCLGAIITVIFGQFIAVWQKSTIAIENIAKLSEIMSPIIVSLMVATGASVSASVYSPSVAFFSTGIVNVILSAVLPLVGIMIVFSIINNLSDNLKLNKFIEFFGSTVKWILGIVIAIFGLFLSVQGIASAVHDGISIKATKYAISNSIPIVGGLLKDGFDIVIAGSVLIKNAVGVVCLVGLFYTILPPLVHILTFSLLLKLAVAIIEPLTDSKIVETCSGISKGVAMLSACVIIAGLAMFLLILLVIISANAFI